MASFTAGTTFTDGVANDVTAAKLAALVNAATPTSGLIQDRTAETAIAVDDTLLIGDASASNDLKRMTVANFRSAATFGTTTSTAATITSGTVTNLASTTGTIATLNSTTGTIANLSATTSTFLGTITGSTNVVNIGSGQIYKDSSGNVGIGESFPSSKFEVRSGTGSNAGAKATYEGAIKINESGLTTLQSTGGIEFKGSVFGSGYGSKILGADDGDLLIGTRSNSASWTERIRIAAQTGNVGIGITSPAAKLDVSGTISVSGANTIGLNMLATGTGGRDYRIGSTDNANGLGGGKFTIYDQTAGASRVLVDSSGNVGIGTSSPTATLHSVSASASTAAGIFQVTATSAGALSAVSVIKQDALSSTNQNFVLFQVNGGSTNSGKINANGANAAAFGSTSDSRLKENITALPSQLDNVCALKPCEFDYKDGSGHQIGFIAQEMQQIYPDSVGVGDDGMLTITAWSKTEARLVKAIQELKAKNDSLEARLQALEAA